MPRLSGSHHSRIETAAEGTACALSHSPVRFAGRRRIYGPGGVSAVPGPQWSHLSNRVTSPRLLSLPRSGGPWPARTPASGLRTAERRGIAGLSARREKPGAVKDHAKGPCSRHTGKSTSEGAWVDLPQAFASPVVPAKPSRIASLQRSSSSSFVGCWRARKRHPADRVCPADGRGPSQSQTLILIRQCFQSAVPIATTMADFRIGCDATPCHGWFLSSVVAEGLSDRAYLEGPAFL